MRFTLYLLLFAAASVCQTLTWNMPCSIGSSTGTCATYPGGTGQVRFYASPISAQHVYLRTVLRGSSSIYTSNDSLFNTSTHAFIDLGGTNVMGIDPCTADTLTQPAERHTDSQITPDRRRNAIWMRAGLNINCNGHTGITADSFYRGDLTTGPDSMSWHKITTSTVLSTYGLDSGALIHDPVEDIVYGWGGNGSQFPVLLYCLTDLNPSPGTLTSAQTTAGCTVADDWSFFFPDQGRVDVSGVNVTRVSGESFPSHMSTITIGGTSTTNGIWIDVASVTDSDHLVLGSSIGNSSNSKWFVHPSGRHDPTAFYEEATQALYFFGGRLSISGAGSHETWTYAPSQKKFVEVAVGTGPGNEDLTANPYNGFAMAYDSVNRKFYRHVATGVDSISDWMLEPTTNTWTLLTSVNIGTTSASVSAFDAATGDLFTFNSGPGGNGAYPEVWIGSITQLVNVSKRMSSRLRSSTTIRR